MHNKQESTYLVDSHCHLHLMDLCEFENSLQQVMQNAQAANVQKMLCVCVSLEDLPMLQKLAAQYPQVKISVGVHPNEVLSSEIEVDALVELALHPACIALGETGLDYFRTKTDETQELQRRRFRVHIRASKITTKPLIIHTRDAAEDTLQLMADEKANEFGGVMHCFSENWSVAKRALDLNFYISFSGIITFKNAIDLQEVVKKIPFDRLLIETDSPWLAPVPFRGKQNQPAFVKEVALKVAELRQIDYDVVAAQTTENFNRCFRLAK